MDKMIVEDKKYKDLQQRHAQMQENYERLLKCAEENKSQALGELTKMYEAKLQDKTQLLAQVRRKEQEIVTEVRYCSVYMAVLNF